MKSNGFAVISGNRLDDHGAALITVVAIFAAVCVLVLSITSLVLPSSTLTAESNNKSQAYLTAKSVLNVTMAHIRSIQSDRGAIDKFVGKTATGELPDMGIYSAVIVWKNQSTVEVTVSAEYKGETAVLVGVVGEIGGGT